jgi:photosystem II stability/assembly factor-like uncharacterized protein
LKARAEVKKLTVLVSALALAGALFSFAATAGNEDGTSLSKRLLLLGAARADETLIAVGERGHILTSTKDSHWTRVLTARPGMLTAVTATSTALLAVGHDALILRSTDKGASWNPVFDTRQLAADDPGRDSPLLAVTCADELVCHAVGAYGLWLHSKDGGQNWTRDYVKEDDRNFYALLAEGSELLLAGEAGALMKSSDGGQEWVALLSPYVGTFFGLLRTPQKALLVFGLRGHIFRSVDDGESWTRIPVDVDTGLMGGRVLSDGRIVIVGAGGTVLISKDDGQSFVLHRQGHRKALSTAIESASGELLLLGEAGVMRME